MRRPAQWIVIGLGCGYLSRFQSSSQRRGNQACDRGDHGGTQHRSDAPDDDLSLCSRPAGHGVDQHPQHRRHHDRSPFRPDVETRRVTIGHPRNNQPASKRSPAPANFDVTSDPPVAPSARSGPGCRSRIEAKAEVRRCAQFGRGASDGKAPVARRPIAPLYWPGVLSRNAA